MKKIFLFLSILTGCALAPLAVQADTLSAHVRRAVAQNASEQKTKYYVPRIQISEGENDSTADGSEAPIFWVEIGVTPTTNGYESEYFYIESQQQEDDPSADGPSVPSYEPIVPAVFNEAYRRFAADPRSVKATFAQTRKMLTTYYRQVQAEQKQKEAKPAN